MKKKMYDVTITRSEQFTIFATDEDEAIDIAMERSVVDSSATYVLDNVVTEHTVETDDMTADERGK